MKKASILILSILGASILLSGCGEKVNTDVESVNKGKGEQVTVQGRDRGEAGGAK